MAAGFCEPFCADHMNMTQETTCKRVIIHNPLPTCSQHAAGTFSTFAAWHPRQGLATTAWRKLRKHSRSSIPGSQKGIKNGIAKVLAPRLAFFTSPSVPADHD